jgi:hypothetical protein
LNGWAEEAFMAFDPKKYLIKLQGNRQYLPVSARLVWFREIHPDWGIETKPLVLDLDKQVAVFEASIFNAEAKLMAKGTKMEDAIGFSDYVEKAETGAIGRALAMCGFGTQFAPELDEYSTGRYVDSPLTQDDDPPRDEKEAAPDQASYNGKRYDNHSSAPVRNGDHKPGGSLYAKVRYCPMPELPKRATKRLILAEKRRRLYNRRLFSVALLRKRYAHLASLPLGEVPRRGEVFRLNSA